MEQQKNPQVQPLGLKKIVSYVSGNVGSTLMNAIASGFIAYYLTDILRISPEQEGITVLVGSILAIVVSFLFGIVLDRTVSDRGKGGIWVRRLFIPFVFFGIVLYAIPDSLPTNTKFILATVLYFVYIAIFNSYKAAYTAMAPNITQDPKSRGTLSMQNMVWGMVIGIIVNNFLLTIVEKLGGGHKGFLYTAILFVAVGSIFSLYFLFTSKEEIREDRAKQKKARNRSLFADIKGLAANKYWILMTLAGVAFSCWFGSFMGSQTYFAIYVLNDPGKIGLLFTASTVPGIISMFVFGPIMAKFGRRKVILATGACSMIGFLLMIFGVSNFPVFFVGLLIRGFFAGPYQGCENGLLNNTVEYGEWKNGFRQEGMISMACSTIKSVFSAIMSGCVGFILAATGYEAGVAQSATALFGIKLLYLYLPMFFCILTYICVFFYRLEDEYPQILAELKNHKGNE